MTQFHAQKDIKLQTKDPLLLPTRTNANSSVRIRSISVDVRPLFQRIAERIAWRKATRMLPQAALSLSRKISSEVNKQFDLMAKEALDKILKGPASYFTEFFANRLKSPEFKFSTEKGRLNVSAIYNNEGAFRYVDTDHNVFLTVSNSFIIELLSQTKGQTLELGLEGALLTLSPQLGPQISFQDNVIKAEILVDHMEVNRVSLPSRNIIVNYKIVSVEGGWSIQKLGATLVLAPGSNSETESTVEEKQIAEAYRKVINDILPEYFPLNDVELKNGNGKKLKITIPVLSALENVFSIAID